MLDASYSAMGTSFLLHKQPFDWKASDLGSFKFCLFVDYALNRPTTIPLHAPDSIVPQHILLNNNGEERGSRIPFPFTPLVQRKIGVTYGNN